MPSIHAGNSSGPLPSVTRCYAEAFFNQPFGDIRLHLDRQPAALGAEAFVQGNALHVLPERFAPKTRAGLSLLGHELAHVVQQRRGMAQRRGPDADVRLDDPVLEREADALGQEFAAFCASRRMAPTSRQAGAAVDPPDDPRRFPVQCSPWLKQHELKPQDEYFWHATTTTNARRIRNAVAIQPVGTGGNGPGFYVAPRITDYIKIMAYRQLKATDWDAMFIFKILARNFYDMTPFFADDGLAGNVGHEVGGFVGSRWAAEIVGDTNYKEPETRTPVHYNQYRGENLPIVGFDVTTKQKAFEVGVGYKAKQAARAAALDKLWACAKGNVIDPEAHPDLVRAMEMYGPRNAFLQSLEEITFKASACPNLYVVGARRFHTTTAGSFAADVDCGLEHVEAVIDLD